jgi:signal transduction histidine kinase
VIARHLSSAMRLSTAIVLVHAPDEHLAPAGSAAERLRASVPGIPLYGPLATLLADSPYPLTTVQVHTECASTPLSGAESAWLAVAVEQGVELWVPLVTGGHLRGVLLVGRRGDGEPFTLQDRQTLAVVGEQAALAAENVALVERLHAQIGDIEQMRDSLEAAVEERTAELQQLHAEGERRALARSREVAAVTHDLMHDLEHLRTYLQTLLVITQPNAQNQELTNQLRINVERTIEAHTALLDDMLCAALLQQDRLTLHPQPVDMVALVARVVGQFEARYQAQGCTLTVCVMGEMASAWCDERRIGRVLRNILLNALNFTSGTRPDAAVEVLLRADERFVHLAVSDNGVGIDAQALQELQLACANAAKGRVRPAGMGVGLRFSARLLALSGGGLTIASQGPGCGTTVTCSLPLHEPSLDRGDSR